MSAKKKLLLRLRMWADRAVVGSKRVQLRFETLSDKLYDKAQALEPGDELGMKLSRNAYLARERCALLFVRYTREITADIERMKRRSECLATLINGRVMDVLLDTCTNVNMNTTIRNAVQEIHAHRIESELEQETDRDESSDTLSELWEAAREAHKLSLMVQKNYHAHCITRNDDNGYWYMSSSADISHFAKSPAYTLSESICIMRIVNQDM